MQIAEKTLIFRKFVPAGEVFNTANQITREESREHNQTRITVIRAAVKAWRCREICSYTVNPIILDDDLTTLENSSPREVKDGSMMIKWHPPPNGWIKVIFDGSYMNSQASTVFVIRDCNGHVLLASANNIGDNSINVAESVALHDGLAAAIDRGWDQIIIEGDSKLVIDSILNKATPPWSICHIIKDIWSLSSSVNQVRFQHVFREANFTADVVAKLGHELSSQMFWEFGLPLSVCSPFYFDLFGFSCSRGFVL
ncbi:hypothetical protein GBA52_015026 [Prunus armeniaca]|nr:hypothetical protein GBA52_015026 [Prunus armeniaca]